MIDDARRIVAAARRIVAFSGAGLSAESGVSTFRDAATQGLWLRHDPTRLASPQGFAEDPDLVVSWYAERRRSVAGAEPNAAHHALVRRGDVLNVTQNVDDLLHRAGGSDIVQLHGSLREDRCHGDCGFRETIAMDDPPPLRQCPDCDGLLRPAVVWFGEALPPDAWELAAEAAVACDVMLVIGTAAEVWPAAGLVGIAHQAGAKIVVVNTNPSAASELADVEVLAPAAQVIPEILA